MKNYLNKYRVSIQAIDEPQRMENALRICNNMSIEGIIPNIFIDKERKGVLPMFKYILEHESKFGIPLVHFQDDVILANGLEVAIENIIKEMTERNIYFLSLYVPRRKIFSPDIVKYRTSNYIPFNNFLWCQGLIIRSEMLQVLNAYAKNYTKQSEHDDVFIADCLKEYGIQAYVHIPGLVQHNIDIRSSISHANSIRRTSEVFDPDYLLKI